MRPLQTWAGSCVLRLALCVALGLPCLSPFQNLQAQIPAPNLDAGSDPIPSGSASLEDRLRVMEESNKKLAAQVEQMKQIYDGVGKAPQQSKGSSAEGPSGGKETGASDALAKAAIRPGDPSVPVPAYLDLDITSSNRIPLRASFGPGFQLQSEDEAFRLQIHYESQVEGRIWAKADQFPVNNGMYLPRQRIFFSGNITKPIEYEFAINRGVGNINVLNAFINIHFDDAFELRFGRYFTPFLYEQYAVSNYWLLTPERSLFSTNLGLNRQFGLMAWGYLFDQQLDYAAGVFNGTRNSFENLDRSVDFVAYLNARPFAKSEWLPFARFLNIGTSFAIGQQDTPPTPVGFRIGAGSPDANIPGGATVPFLILNPDVVERGDRLLGSVHAAWYYGGLSLLGEWQYGYGTYANHQTAAQVPLSGFYVAGGYFLTGEEVEQRTRVKPRRPFVPLNEGEERGPGAWEVTSRVSQLRLGDQFFASGFADENRWSRSAITTEVGLNWYWNDYTRRGEMWHI